MVPDGLNEILGDTFSAISCRMGAASRPVDPCHTAVCIERPVEHVQVCGDVMLIRIARGPAVLPEEGVVLGLSNYVDGQLTVELEPLRTLPPLAKLDHWVHVIVIAATAMWGVFIVGLHKAVG